MSKVDKYKNFSSKKYLNLIRPYLRDLINKQNPTAEINDNKDSNDNNNNNKYWKL